MKLSLENKFNLPIASRSILSYLILGVLLGLLWGCAGPATPLGAVWAWTPGQASAKDEMEQARHASRGGLPKIEFLPARQILHGPSRMRVVIEDETVSNLSDSRLLVHYNGLDISRSFLNRSRVSYDPHRGRIVIDNPRIRLSATSDHFIEVAFRNPRGLYAYARYEPPRCDAFRALPVLRLGKFSAHRHQAELIERISRAKGLNPAFATGLVAQESGFNPMAISWARALGLTQITPVAEVEVLRMYEGWPSYPGLNDKTVSELRELVDSGVVNERNEWRLDEELSVRGGLQYVKLLSERWSSPRMRARIQELFADPEVAETRLILASYHSGFTRVADALARDGRDWLSDPGLSEARKYVNRIFSFCNYFSEKEIDL